MKPTLILIVQVIGIFSICAADDVPCETIQVVKWDAINEASVKSCRMQGSTKIPSQGTYISSSADSLITGLTLRTNKQILFLPSRVDLKFPNLKFYSAGECAIQKVSKGNFQNLKRLTHLWLHDNRLDSIPKKAFEDLIAIEKIYLKNNNIKVLNGETFAGLPQLNSVDLENNECINELFNAQTISDIVNKVNVNCQFCESSKTIDELICELSKQTTRVDENLKQVARIATLEAQLIASEEAKTLFQLQLQELKQIYKNCEVQWCSRCSN